MSYLLPDKSVTISAPAGSGKTEKLARRYISLLKSGSRIEKILCITFTEKAAAGMKERILGLLRAEEPELYATTITRSPLMRISTMHAFCFRVLKRFTFELGLDPSLEVAEAHVSGQIWAASVQQIMNENPEVIRTLSAKRGIKGHRSLRDILDKLYYMRPYPELLFTTGGVIDPKSSPDTEGLLGLFRQCLDKYRLDKRARHLLDYADLEYLAYTALSLGQEAHNILFSFDEHTDHLLVDEFQDTSTIQWKIIDLLTEEWRAGYGAKRSAGITPTMFLVGDDKQSIYLFRGANVSVFHEAHEKLDQWLGPDHVYIEVTTNYRCLPAVVGFVNQLFESVMPRELLPSWKTAYVPFEPDRKGAGSVELLLHASEGNTLERRQNEAALLARWIGGLLGRREVYDNDATLRPCEYRDMAILIRKRTHLAVFEEALHAMGIPFVILKGTGFYQEPEVALVRELVSLAVDLGDSHALFNILRSPIIAMDYATIYAIVHCGQRDTPLIQKLRSSENAKASEAAAWIDGWLGDSAYTPLAELVEKALVSGTLWGHFAAADKRENIRKMLTMIESLESGGASRLMVRETLLKLKDADESKANVNTEGMNAVRLMTVHAAKGLEFPMVFLPSVEDTPDSRLGNIAIDETEAGLTLCLLESGQKPDKVDIFRTLKAKHEEEDKRLFYVAATRARDHLHMLGALPAKGSPTGWLDLMDQAFGVCGAPRADMPLRLLFPEDIPESTDHAPKIKSPARKKIAVPVHPGPIEYTPGRTWRDVTAPDEYDTHLRSHGAHWRVLGTVLHIIFDELSRGTLALDAATGRAAILLRTHGAHEGLLDTVLLELAKLKDSDLLCGIILPSPKDERAYTELPFIYERGRHVYRGRMDRVIIRGGVANVYDYKTFPVSRDEFPAMKEKYGFQMRTYQEAAAKLFSLPARAYLLFASLPEALEV